MKDKQQSLDDLKQQLLLADPCPELKVQAKQLVFGDGNPDADILFVGEAPGKNEDLEGRPFVGSAGKFLNEMLGSINLDRQQVYITNIVKYRPPNNRDPLPEEKKAFLPYLRKQIEIIQPKIVITLGRHSLNCFLPDQVISEVHGQAKRIKLALGAPGKAIEIVLLPLFHPAAALYNGGLRKTLMEDFLSIPFIIQSLTKEKEEIIV